MLYYNKIIISVEKNKNYRDICIKKSKINKHFIMLPDNDGVEEYTLLFR